jgi:hypothetical protein
MKPTIKACPVTLPELKSDGPTSSSVLWFARSAVPVRATRVIKTRPPVQRDPKEKLCDARGTDDRTR